MRLPADSSMTVAGPRRKRRAGVGKGRLAKPPGRANSRTPRKVACRNRSGSQTAWRWKEVERKAANRDFRRHHVKTPPARGLEAGFSGAMAMADERRPIHRGASTGASFGRLELSGGPGHARKRKLRSISRTVTPRREAAESSRTRGWITHAHSHPPVRWLPQIDGIAVMRAGLSALPATSAGGYGDSDDCSAARRCQHPGYSSSGCRIQATSPCDTPCAGIASGTGTARRQSS